VVTPLLCAVRADNVELVALLLANGANPEEENKQGVNPFMLAVNCGYEHMEVLIALNQLSLLKKQRQEELYTQ
jgi:ankyrin repeat protein